jgi:hypothetical protein
VTSNKSFADWGEVFNDPVLATAILFSARDVLKRFLFSHACMNILRR